MYYVLTFVGGIIGGLFCIVPAFIVLRERKHRLDERFREYESKATKLKEYDDRVRRLEAQQNEFAARIISYKELQAENGILKRDLQNIDVNLNKLQLDHDVQQKQQSELGTKVEEVGARYLKEAVKWIGQTLNANNFATCKQRLLDIIGRLREIGFGISAEEEQALVSDLKANYERAVRAAFEREEQARIRAQIREEEKLRREIDREIAQAERERAVIQAALAQAMAKAQDQHSAEIEHLKTKLAAAEERTVRAISQAQLTKAGHVYIISNIGTFGEGVFKIGMTRRLDPKDRIFELGDASVPFPFDIHMMISSKDAPALENALHRALHKSRLNKMNPRKEFFRADLETICNIVAAHHGQVEYIADPEALEFKQSISMSEVDAEYVESVYNALEDDGEETSN